MIKHPIAQPFYCTRLCLLMVGRIGDTFMTEVGSDGTQNTVAFSSSALAGCPRLAPARCNADVRVRRRPPGRKRPTAGQGTKTLTARTACYVEGKSKFIPPTSLHCPKASAERRLQTQRRPEASGIKAGRLQLGTRHGAEPASPTARCAGTPIDDQIHMGDSYQPEMAQTTAKLKLTFAFNCVA